MSFKKIPVRFMQEGIIGNIQVKLFEIWTSGSEEDVV